MQKPNFFKKNWLLLLIIAYVISPLDLLPDTVPVIGTMDDILLVIIELIRQYRMYKNEKDASTKVEPIQTTKEQNIVEGVVVDKQEVEKTDIKK